MTDIKIVHSECLAYLRTIPDNTFDSIVTDPPYGLKFMAKKWDYDVPSTEIWAECLRVLKPGGYLLAFAGTRTQHRMAVRIEDAGFEIRDMIAWVYGCLDEQTEVATANGVMPYHKTKVGDLVLCYDSSDGEYSYQPILEIVEYEYSDTAYRLVGDFGEQVVSRNHRVIVERGGSETFQLAETLECEARVPVLEDLPALQQAIHDSHAGAGTAQGVRAWGGHRSTLVRVVPFHYTGKVWCLRVPTGAFVAVRNGVAFPTGNSGFPKSMDVSKAIDKAAGAEREVVGRKANYHSEGKRSGTGVSQHGVQDGSFSNPDLAAMITAPATQAAQQWQGWGTALKPALEPITVARKPFKGTVAANVLAHGTGALNIDGCRIATDEKLNGGAGGLLSHQRDDKEYPEADNGYDPNTLGRWPANLIHDGSDEVMAQFPTTASGKANIKRQSGTEFFGNSGAAYGDESRPAGTEMISYGDKGSAARFFYCAKASPTDRNEGCDDLPAKSAGDMTGGRKEGSAGLNNPRAGAGRTSGGKNFWPTVKPTELMRYLVKLVTPPGGRLLDPFCGSGSTGKACAIDGVDCTLIDMDEEAVMITEARVSQAAGQPIKRDPTVKPPHWDDDLDGEWVPSASSGKSCK